MLQLMQYFGLPDSNQIIYQIIKTKYAKRAVNSLFVLITSFLIRTILYTLISFKIMYNNDFIDFFMQCGISIFLCMQTHYVQSFVNHFNEEMYSITRYIINNFSEENLKKWKTCGTFLFLSMLLIYFGLVEITSRVLQIYTLQYGFCYFIIDIIENQCHPVRLFIKKNSPVLMNNSEYCLIDCDTGIYDNFSQEHAKTATKTTTASIIKRVKSKSPKRVIVVDNNDNSGFVVIDKKIIPNKSSEFDLLTDLSRCGSEFDIIN